MTMLQVSHMQLLCVCGAQRLPGSLRSLHEALQDFPTSWDIGGCLWVGVRSCLQLFGDTGVTQPRHLRDACAGTSFRMI